jgi:hypothetical protein
MSTSDPFDPEPGFMHESESVLPDDLTRMSDDELRDALAEEKLAEFEGDRSTRLTHAPAGLQIVITATRADGARSKALEYVGRINGVAYGSGATEAEAIESAVRILHDGISRDGVRQTLYVIDAASKGDRGAV